MNQLQMTKCQITPRRKIFNLKFSILKQSLMKEFEITPKLCYGIKNYLNKNSIKTKNFKLKIIMNYNLEQEINPTNADCRV
jgi:hypothetical protein